MGAIDRGWRGTLLRCLCQPEKATWAVCRCAVVVKPPEEWRLPLQVTGGVRFILRMRVNLLHPVWQEAKKPALSEFENVYAAPTAT